MREGKLERDWQLFQLIIWLHPKRLTENSTYALKKRFISYFKTAKQKERKLEIPSFEIIMAFSLHVL